MTLRDKFISFTECFRNAEQLLHQHGPADPNTVKAFEESNNMKREILDRMDDIEKYIKLAEREAMK